MRLPLRRPSTLAPLAVAGLFAVPVFFMSLLLTSLALDHPHVVNGKPGPTASGVEATIWAAALIAPAVVLAVGVLALPAGRFGVFAPIAVGIAACIVLPDRAGGYFGRHERRFPIGMDFVPDSTSGNASSRGDYEHAAKSAMVGISHWTLVLAGLAVLAALIVLLRRPAPAAVETATVDPVTGVAHVSPAIELAEADSDLARGGLAGRWRNRNR